MDPIGSCLRERCECDLQLAKKLSEHEENWNVENHRRWGDNPFNAEERCRAPHHKTTTQAYIAPSTAAPLVVTTQQVITTTKYKKTKESVQNHSAESFLSFSEFFKIKIVLVRSYEGKKQHGIFCSSANEFRRRV